MNFTYTPTPYYVVKHTDGWTIQTRANGVGYCIAQQYCDSSLENAQFIVTACNHHQPLVTTLQRLLERYEMDAAKPASGTSPHEVIGARNLLNALDAEMAAEYDHGHDSSNRPQSA